MDHSAKFGEVTLGQTAYGSFPSASDGREAASAARLRPCQHVVSAQGGASGRHGKRAHVRPAGLRRDRALLISGPESFTAAFLVVDVRGWGEIVHDLGPYPRSAARLIQYFWDSTAPVIRESGGKVYAWRGDGLLVAYRGKRRMERALKAAECLLAVVRDQLAPGVQPQLRTASARTTQFAITAAITDGRAVPVPVRFGTQYSEELTGDWVNTAFSLVKWATAGTVGITWEICRWLTENSPASLRAFSWHEPQEILLAGANRRVLQGTPITVMRDSPGSDPSSSSHDVQTKASSLHETRQTRNAARSEGHPDRTTTRRHTPSTTDIAGIPCQETPPTGK